jgi:tetratricopeptide (TPR) repeat protein
MGDRTDPEALRAIMGGYYDQMRVILERHGGAVEKFVGDAVMAVFGIPVSHEDDALRAVRAAWQMRSAVAELGLTARIGVNTGEVVTGAGETLVTGDAVNVAARLEQHAPGGEVLIGRQTQRLVRDAVQSEPVQLDVKGKAAPIGAYRLLSVDLQAPAVARRLDNALVGRKRELGVLHQAFEHTVTDRACHLFTLLGSAGVGKSRLVGEFLNGLDATVLRGRCLDYGDGITYWPVVEVLKQLGPVADPTVSLIDHGRTSAAELFWAVRAQLEAAAGTRPLVVVFDDIHWGEPTFLDLLDHIADLSREAPILLLCLARPELIDVRPGWGGGKLNASTLLLEPLSTEESAELVESLDRAVDAATRGRILTTAAGNPLFLEEMLALVHEGGSAVSARVPETIQALLQARLDQLGPGERAVLERGAVEGELFHRDAVSELTAGPDRANLHVSLTGLVRKELIRSAPATLAGQEAFRFRHLLMRDAAYDSLPKAVRAQLHEAFANWLAVAGTNLVEADEILGYHLGQAAGYRRELGDPDPSLEARAAARLGDAGSKALLRDDLPAANQLLGRALSLLPPGAAAIDRVSLDLLSAVHGLGDIDREDVLIAKLESSSDPLVQMRGRLARLDLGLATAQDVTAEARRAAQEAIELFEPARDDAGLARAWSLLYDVEWLASRAGPSLNAIDRALGYANRAGDATLVSQLHLLRTGPLMFGPFTPAFVRGNVAELAELAQSSPRIEQAYLFLEASLASESGDFEAAWALYERSDAILLQLGMKMVHYLMMDVAGGLALRQGRLADAVRITKVGYDGLGAVGATGFQSTAAVNLAAALYAIGDLDEAERYATVGEVLGGQEDIVNFAQGRSVRAKVLADRGELSEAHSLGRSALNFALQTDFPDVRAKALLALAYVLRRTGAVTEADSLTDQAVAEFELRGDFNAVSRVAR